MMKEHPILFSGEMVKAILEGRKTQTRRIVKPQPTMPQPGILIWKNDEHFPESTFTQWMVDRCPYGKVGDHLWVRETFMLVPHTAYAQSTNDGINQIPHQLSPDGDWWAVYRADWQRAMPSGYWKPSIHMPRWASRITLEITNIRVERLQDITPSDVRAEGLPDLDGSAIGSFASLWNKINGKRASWKTNPWVWVVEFRRIDG